MEETGDVLKKRKDKLVNWLKNPYNLAFIALFALIIIIRLYYFILTKNQPLWWDESQYMSGAKDIAGIVKYDLAGPRTPFLSFVMSTFFFLNLTSEPVMRFIALLIPSLIVILLVYLCVKEMYNDKKIALISMIIAGFLWEHLFYSNRFHTENFSLIFLLLATLVLFKCYVKKEDLFFIKAKYSILWIIIFAVISVLFRAGTIVAFPPFFLFMFLLNKDKLLFTKKGIIFSIFIVILIILSILYVPKLSISKPYLETFFNLKNPIAWNSLGVFNGFYQSVIPNIPPILFYFFLAGIIIFLLDLFLGYERLIKIKLNNENLNFKSDIFNFLTICFVLFTFIFLIKLPTFEFRWFFPFLVAMLAFTSNGIVRVIEYLLSLIYNNKKFIIIIILIIAAIGAYNQLYHSDMIIKNKIDSYSQVKEAGLWIKQNSNPEDTVISSSQPQITYYSERETETFYFNGPENDNETVFNEKIKNFKPRYVVISIFEPAFTPKWAYDWPSKNNESVKPVMAYFLDIEQKQLALVIYEVDYSEFNIAKDNKAAVIAPKPKNFTTNKSQANNSF